MCVAQYRDYIKASKFKRDTGTFADDLEDENLEVRKNSYKIHYNNGVEYDRTYYVTDLNRLQELAENNNMYAINHLKKMKKAGFKKATDDR